MIRKVIASIDGVDYEMPQEITVSHYSEVMRRISMSETEMEKAMDIISVIMNIPYQVIRELEVENIAELSVYIQNKIQDCDVAYIPQFKFKDVEYGGLDLMEMTFGEYVDLVTLIKNDVTIYMNIHKICAILYRPITNKTSSGFDITPYDIKEHKRMSELFLDLPVKYFFGALTNLYLFLRQMRKDFEILFGEDLDLPDDRKEEKKDDSNLPWYKMIMALTNEDFTKIEYVTARPAVECFNHLTYLTIKNQELKQAQLEHQNKMNLYK